MKKVCLSTYCEWSSYGSIMQAIGLKKTLQDLGCESFIVRDVPAPLAQRDFPLAFSNNPKTVLKNMIDFLGRKHKRALYEKTVCFINENVDIQYFNDYEALKKHIPKADYYIAGSDQIWHPSLCKPSFFLDFLGEDKKRLSYAASMGATQVPSEKEEVFQSLVSKFDTISVREEEMIPALKKYIEKPVRVHIDPTFLVSAQEWRKLETEYYIKKPYILVYAIYWNSALNKELKQLHKETGYEIIGLCPAGISKLWANKKIQDADPGQFLYLIDHAEAVVSSSFHGVAFSLIFNKKLAPIINPAAPSRINTLLEALAVKRETIADIMKFDLTKYGEINERILNQKDRSISFLKEILEYNE